MRDIKLRFESKFTVTPGCWLWTASTRLGYGRFRVGKSKVTASRFSYELYVAPIGDGLFVCHQCDNPSCVNPDHLFLGTRQENVTDMVNKNRHLSFRKRGVDNPKAKLDAGQVRSILSDKRSQSVIARDYGVGQACISKIKLGKVWRHL